METTIDNYKEHIFHETYEGTCSECFNENRIMKAKALVNKDSEEYSYCKFCGTTKVEDCKCNDSANQYSGEE
jgi:hypothetical protein